MKISIIGTGNLAAHLSDACVASGVEVLQVWGRNPQKAAKVAAIAAADILSDFGQLDLSADLLLLAVSDDAIAEVAAALAPHVRHIDGPPIVAHLSGATPLAIFEGTGLQRYGVFWPLQSFRSGKQVDFRKVPVCINGSDEFSTNALRQLGETLSEQVHIVSEMQRQLLHLAAVFVNNFTNHLLTISKTLTDEAKVPFHLLKPLLLETVNRLQSADPHQLQTGPAIRGDLNTIERHMRLLASRPSLQQLYALLSQSIASWQAEDDANNKK